MNYNVFLIVLLPFGNLFFSDNVWINYTAFAMIIHYLFQYVKSIVVCIKIYNMH